MGRLVRPCPPGDQEPARENQRRHEREAFLRRGAMRCQYQRQPSHTADAVRTTKTRRSLMQASQRQASAAA